jgi:hypothetical protein
MTKKLSLLAVALTMLACGCVKNQSEKHVETSLISEAQEFFDKNVASGVKTFNPANYRAKQPRTVQWPSATIQHYAGGDAVIVPILYRNNLFISHGVDPGHAYSLSDLTSLVITKDSSGNFQSAIVTYIPDSANGQGSPRGTYLVEDWQGNTIYRPVHLGSVIGHQSVASSSKEVDYVQSIQVCDEIDGYNYSPDDLSGGVAWSETTCTSCNLPAGLPQVGLPPSRVPTLPPARILSSLQVIVAPPTSPISNIADYLKCFTFGSSPGQTYTVQVCVDQPDAGTRQPWGLTSGGAAGTFATGNPVNTGHTFLVLTENNQGNIISRNVGFYPSNFVFPTPVTLSSQGALNNDQSHTFNISLTINVSSNQFFNILNYVELGNNAGYYYNLNTNNCTTFVINTVAAGGISLPATEGSWPGGEGYDPGDLGEDIRNMPLTSNMTRNTVENNHPNIGTCN